MAGLIIISHRLDPSVVPKYPVPPLRGTGNNPVINPVASPVPTVKTIPEPAAEVAGNAEASRRLR